MSERPILRVPIFRLIFLLCFHRAFDQSSILVLLDLFPIFIAGLLFVFLWPVNAKNPAITARKSLFHPLGSLPAEDLESEGGRSLAAGEGSIQATYPWSSIG